MGDYTSKKQGWKLSILFLLILVLLLPGCQQIAEPGTTQLQTTPSVTQEISTSVPETVDATTGPTPQLQWELEHGYVQQPGQEAVRPATPPVAQGHLEVHFIDVGQADAALVLCNGQSLLIDGGNVADSSRMYTYLKNKGITYLDYVIGTHAHEDHIGGIAGALNYATAGVVYCPVTSYSSTAFNNFVKAVQKQGRSITVPTAGTSFSLGGATCTILAVNTTSDTNNSSIVLRITYGSTSFLFTGDAETEVEYALINRGAPLGSTVLKVGHHGSGTSTSYAWLWNVMPQYAVISVGTGNSYGHPHENVLSRLRDANVKTYRTDLQGDIVCVSYGSSVNFTVSRNANADTLGGIGNNSTQNPPEETQPTLPSEDPTTSQQTHYVLNTNSLKFHEATCENAAKISQKNREDYYGTREELLEQGYDPCGFCNP